MFHISKSGLLFAASFLAVALSPNAHAVKLNKSFGPQALTFIPNLGQAAAETRFQVLGGDTTVSFTDTGLQIVQGSSGERSKSSAVNGLDLNLLHNKSPATAPSLQFRFVDARTVEPVGKHATAAQVSYFQGGREHWRSGEHTWSSLVYKELWPGIDLVWTGKKNALEYEVHAAPKADLSSVGIEITGASQVTVNAKGDLEIVTPTRRWLDPKPLAWQELAQGRVDVPVDWVVEPSRGGYKVGFRTGAHDPGAPVVIDPAVLTYATYLGGSGNDRGLGVAVDSSGNAYICGETPSASSIDAYVAKYDASGAVVYVALLGGNNYDGCFDIAVDAAGQAYIVGATTSTQTSFPTYLGPDTSYNGGNSDAFLCKINAAGNAVLYCGYIGGSDYDFAEGVRVDANGAAFVSGLTNSTQSTFPVKVGPDLTYNGKGDSFIAKVVPDPTSPTVLNNFAYSGYIGGNAIDYYLVQNFASNGHVAIDAAGAAYVSGMTKSGPTTFPNGSGFGALPTWDKTLGGAYDAYAVKIKPDGSGFVYAGYVGGSKNDFGYGAGVDDAGNFYFTGDTSSTESSFQPVLGPDLTFNGNTDIFICKINAAGTARGYCGYLGGNKFDQGHGLAVNGAGNAYLSAHAVSTQATFPVVNGPDLTHNGSGVDIGDAVICKVKLLPNNPNPADNYDYCGYVGGSGEDHAFWIALDAAGSAYLVGDTNSTETTFPDGDGFSGLPGHDQTEAGSYDAFLVNVVEQ